MSGVCLETDTGVNQTCLLLLLSSGLLHLLRDLRLYTQESSLLNLTSAWQKKLIPGWGSMMLPG